MKTFIIGHLKPDTDSVVAPMALAALYQAVDCFGYDNPEAVLTTAINPETAYILNKFGVTAPRVITASEIASDDQVVLVDHNEPSQRLVGLKSEQIVEILDHHKAKLDFERPIFMTFKTWGCSCTIIYYLMKQVDFTPDKTLASLMLAAILSDTLGFKSSTCTDKDIEIAQELAKIAEISDLDAFSLEIFKAKSDVSKLSCSEIVKNDYKLFDFNGKKVMIDQLETVEQAKIIAEKKTCLLTAMEKVKAELGVDAIFVVISDILKVNSKLLILSETEKQIAETAFGSQVNEQVLDIGAKLSRKKEIAPAIQAAC